MRKTLKLTFSIMFLCATVIIVNAAQDKFDISGSWAFTVETSAGSGAPSMTFKQAGETLTGKYSGQLGEADLNGTVKGNKIEFSFEAGGGVVVYTGTIEKDSMSGKVSLGDQASGTWKAKRK
jgi:hypothetical protein